MSVANTLRWLGLLIWLGSVGAHGQTAAKPVASPASGYTSYAQFNVTLTDSTPGAKIYYTLDGSTPTTASSPWVTSGGTVLISQPYTLLTARAFASGYTSSSYRFASYYLTGQIAAGWYHTISLKTDGTVWAWGLNSSGELGDGTTAVRTAPQQVPGLSGIVAISAGHYHTLALKNDNTVWAWGLNSNGQLGDGSTTQRNSPVEVLKSNGSGGTIPLTGIVAITAGAYHNLALDSSGNVWAWGLNSDGQLGDGGTTQQNIAEELTTLGGVNVKQLAAGSYHSLLLTTGGAVEAWGLNTNGQLGDGTTTQRYSPVPITGLSGVTITQVTGGEWHSLALQNDGTVWGWGWNGYFSVDATGSQHVSPVHNSSLSNVVSVLAEYHRSFAIETDGTIVAWGYNQYGELGDGILPLAQQSVVAMTGIAAVGVASGQLHTEVLQNDGTIWACGYNNDNQLGSGFADDNVTPVQIDPAHTYIAAASAAHDLFIDSNHNVWAMGDNSYGDLGDGTQLQRSTPEQVSGVSNAIAVAAGTDSLVLESNGTVWSWGYNGYGQLGAGINATEQDTPVQVGATTPGFTNITAISVGPGAGYAVKSDGTVWAWGNNSNGELGTGSTTWTNTPVQVGASVSGFSNITAISASRGNEVMALDANGHVWTWGGNDSGQLGDGTTTQHNSPEEVMLSDGVTPLGPIVAIQANLGYCMAIDNSGYVWVWGFNGPGCLGDGTTTNRYRPEMLTGIGGVQKFICPMPYHTLVLKTDGTVWGWGPNWQGALGTGNTAAHFTPYQVNNYAGATATSPSDISAVVLKVDGHLEGSGPDDYGIMGLCTYSIPFAIPGFNTFAIVTPPTVTISAPSNNSTLPLGQSETFTANASATGGTIESVSYYINSTLIGTTADLASNFPCTWTPTTWGSYVFYAVATDSNGYTSYCSPSVTVNVPYTGWPAPPLFSPGSGTYATAQNVTISSPTPNSTIYYTTDGTSPTTSSPSIASGNALTVSTNETVHAFATAAGLGNSGVSTAAYTIIDGDGNGLPDAWELQYFNHIGNDPYSSPDGNGLSLLQDYQQGNDPTNYYSQNGGIVTPTLTIASGNNQVGSPGAFTSQPLVVTVTNSSTQALLANAPVNFSVTSGGGLIATALHSDAGTQPSLSVRANSSGQAQVYYLQPTSNNTTSTIQAASGGQTASFTASTSLGDGTFDAPTGLSAAVASPTEIDLSWVNHASTATSITIQESTDNDATWTTIATLTDPTATTYAVTNITQGQGYDFQIYASK